MNTPNQTQSVETPLKGFEAALEAPIVPGEFEGWLESVEGAFQELEAVLESHLNGDHRRQLQEAQQQDADLLTRLEHMRQTDQKLLDHVHHLKRHIHALRERENGDGETQRVDRSAERMVEDGLRFVIDVRKQEAAVNTWFMEAFQRDRGVAD